MESSLIELDKKFKHVVSLGYFCSIALELQKINIRSASYPFDWLITPSIEKIIFLIEHNFDNFILQEDFYQFSRHPERYKNVRTGMSHFHDFSEFKTFDAQYRENVDKYNRRINRFYKNIMEPTLFLRYIYDNSDLSYINENAEKIEEILKSYNSQNKIIYIANKELFCEKNVGIYYVVKDESDTVARTFLDQLEELNKYIQLNCEKCTSSIPSPKKKSRVIRSIHKVRRFIKFYYKHDKVI